MQGLGPSFPRACETMSCVAAQELQGIIAQRTGGTGKSLLESFQESKSAAAKPSAALKGGAWGSRTKAAATAVQGTAAPVGAPLPLSLLWQPTI